MRKQQLNLAKAILVGGAVTQFAINLCWWFVYLAFFGQTHTHCAISLDYTPHSRLPLLHHPCQLCYWFNVTPTMRHPDHRPDLPFNFHLHLPLERIAMPRNSCVGGGGCDGCDGWWLMVFPRWLQLRTQGWLDGWCSQVHKFIWSTWRYAAVPSNWC